MIGVGSRVDLALVVGRGPQQSRTTGETRITLINRLIPNYPTFLTIGLLIVVSGLFVLLAGRDILISIWVNKLFDGTTDDGFFKTAQIAEQVIGHTLTVWFFLGLRRVMKW